MMPPQKKRVRVFLTLQNQTKYLRDLQKQAKNKGKQNHCADFARLLSITGLLFFDHRQLWFLGHSTLPGLRILQGPLVCSISPTIPAFLHFQRQCGHLPWVTVTHRPASVLWPGLEGIHVYCTLKGETTALTFYIQSLLPVQRQVGAQPLSVKRTQNAVPKIIFPNPKIIPVVWRPYGGVAGNTNENTEPEDPVTGLQLAPRSGYSLWRALPRLCFPHL